MAATRIRTNSDVQNPRNSGLGLRAGLGDPEPYCDCSNSPSFVAESNWRVIIVSLQYLIMMCRTHCQKKGVSIPSRLAPPEVIQSSDGGIVAAIRKLAIRYSSRSASSFKPVKKKALDLTSGTFKWGTSGTSKWPGGGGRGNGIIKGKSKKTQQQQAIPSLRAAKRRADNNGNKRPWLKLPQKLVPHGAEDRMDTGDDEDEERRGGEDIAKVKDNEIERPDDDDDDDDEDEVEDSLGSAATGNFRVKKSRAPELAMGKRYWRALSCPTYCSKETSPVCGSDGVIYKNDCDMRKRTCNRDVKAQDFKYCSQPEGSRCEHKCAKEKDLVCGSDGRTYLNKCFLMVEFCEHGITFSHYGSCTKDEPADEDKCPKSCSKRSRSRDGPVCGSDGNVYPSDCEMRKRTCGTGVVAVDRRHCQTTAHCDSGCWRISRLTCGSDGKLYNNGCQMHRKNCGKMVFDVPVPFCLNKLYRTDCPIDCRAEKDDRVCGSDGNIYRNQCELEKITCGYPLTRYERVTGVEWSLCAAKNSSCSKMNCPSDVDEMCGNDGVTYDNACLLRKATCTSGVQLSHVGACTDLSVIENKSDCPKNCDSENEDGDGVVCGSDGNVYRSMCELRMRTCGQRVVRAPYSHCEGTKSCDADCSAAGDGMTTVCASDALFYKSECHMRKDNCGRHVYVAPLSTCMKNFDFKFSGCGRVCPSEYDPVCGDDGKTYSNQCFMEMENCRARSLGGVKRKYYGKCGSPKQKARHYLYKK